MKLSSFILTGIAVLGVIAIAASNLLLKKEYERADKNDPYWNYEKVENKPFHHLYITGGNITNINFEQSNNTAVKVLRSWRGLTDGSLKSHVQNDTLYIRFSNELRSVGEKFWMRRTTPLRIFSPQLFSITGHDTKLIIDKFNGSSLNIKMSGDSRMLVNSYRQQLDSLTIFQQDSSKTYFVMSKDIIGVKKMNFKEVKVTNLGQSSADLGNADIGQLNLDIVENAEIMLSGASLNKWKASN